MEIQELTITEEITLYSEQFIRKGEQRTVYTIRWGLDGDAAHCEHSNDRRINHYQ